MADLVLAIFSNRTQAESAINNLVSQGYDAQEMSIVLKDTEETTEISENTGVSVVQGATEGAVTGGIVGGIAGLLVGVGAIAIPGIGGLLIGGPLAAALGLSGAAATTVSGAATGAVAGGLLGALVGLGIPQEQAEVYEREIRAGGVLLAVPVQVDGSSDVQDVLVRNGADQVRPITVANYAL